MPNKRKVVPILEAKPSLVAMDEKSRRYVLQIGRDRVAFDYTLRATKLPPVTGDEPRPLLQMKKRTLARPPRKATER
jgi:hypothetical protein